MPQQQSRTQHETAEAIGRSVQLHSWSWTSLRYPRRLLTGRLLRSPAHSAYAQA
jgi:hypothetical protein